MNTFIIDRLVNRKSVPLAIFNVPLGWGFYWDGWSRIEPPYRITWKHGRRILSRRWVR